jgi:hypothetical protein
MKIDPRERTANTLLRIENIFSALHRPFVPCCDVGAGNSHIYASLGGSSET